MGRCACKRELLTGASVKTKKKGGQCWERGRVERRVALVRGCHIIAKGNHAQANVVIPQISRKGLAVGPGFHGTGAYGFYIDAVPRDQARHPLVVFDVEDIYVEKKTHRLPARMNYAFMLLRDPTTHNVFNMMAYIPIDILGFMNVFNPLLRIYHGPIGII